MVLPGLAGLDTPRTNLGDSTFLTRPPDFDMTQEPSFQSPSKDANVFQRSRNGGRTSLKTPRGPRLPFTDRRNLPSGISGPEFTPLLKSATRNSAKRYNGKENGVSTPTFLDRIDEDLTPVPAIDLSSYGASKNISSIIEGTPLPQVSSSSLPSSPMLKTRGDGNGALLDGNQLSLREQENVIDRIEKENFGLKLKIHFLEDALRKAGPGFNEAALKENTDLKVDKVTMQRDLQRHKKHLISAEKELESYRQQVLEMQAKAKLKHADANQRAEIEKLRRELEQKDADIDHLQRELQQAHKDADKVDKLQDDIGDLEADLREKERKISQQEDELEDLRLKSDSTEDRMKDAQRHMVELEEKAQSGDKLQEAKETIADLEADVRRLEQQVDELKDKVDEAVSEKERAEEDLGELHEEMANKSVVTKGFSRQTEEKAARLQGEVDKTREECAQLQQRHDTRQREAEDLKVKLKESRQARDSAEHDSRSVATKLQHVEAELTSARDRNSLLQTRHDALANDAALLQRDISKLQKATSQLEESLEQERQHGLGIERDVRREFKDEMDRLNSEISDLQAEVRERENLYDNDSEKWDAERHTLESERDRAEERAAGLQRTIERLREAEGTLTSKEMKLQDAISSETERHKSEEAVLTRQIKDLQHNLEARQEVLNGIRNELSAVRDELRQTQLNCQTQKATAEGLEDEVEVLQATLDEQSEKARRNEDLAKEECNALKNQLATLREAASSSRFSTAASGGNARQNDQLLSRLNTQLADSAASFARVTKEKHALEQQLTNLSYDLSSARAALVEANAERDAMDNRLVHFKQQENDTLQLNQEGVELRTSKTKLEKEIRHLKEENKLLVEQRQAVEKTLEDELEKAADEEERLGHEIRQLQMSQFSSKGHKTSESQRIEKELRRLKDENELLKEERLALEKSLEGEIEKAATEEERLGNEIRQLQASQFSTKGYNKSSEVSRLENEVRRLKEQIQTLAQERLVLEQSLEEELEKAAAEESRLGHDISRLQANNGQAKKRHNKPSDSHDLSAARRTIRDLKRRIEKFESQSTTTTAGNTSVSMFQENSGDMYLLRRDLSDARAKERELLRREGSHKETIKTLRRQVAEVERAAHEAEVKRLAASPVSILDSGRKTEIFELRHQLTTAHQSIQELKKSVREADRQSASAAQEVQAQAQELQAQVDEAEELRKALRDAEQKSASASRALQGQLESTIEELKKSLEYAERQSAAAAEELEIHVSEAEDLQKALHDAERQSASASRELQAHIARAEEQKVSFEQQLSDVRAAAGQAAEAQDVAVGKLTAKLERVRRERDSLAQALAETHNDTTVESAMSRESRKDLNTMLRKTQIEVEALRREVGDAHDAAREASRADEALRKKLERARSDRALYRTDAERLQLEVAQTRDAAREATLAEESLRKQLERVQGERASYRADVERLQREVKGLVQAAARVAAEEIDTRVVSRAGKEVVVKTDFLAHWLESHSGRQHEKGTMDLSAQVSYLLACLERERRLREYAADAKKYVMFQMEFRTACNSAQIHALHDVVRLASRNVPMCLAYSNLLGGPFPAPPRFSLQRLGTVVRFVVRLRLAASRWAKCERAAVRPKKAALEPARRDARDRDGSRRDRKRKHHHQPTVADEPELPPRGGLGARAPGDSLEDSTQTETTR